MRKLKKRYIAGTVVVVILILFSFFIGRNSYDPNHLKDELAILKNEASEKNQLIDDYKEKDESISEIISKYNRFNISKRDHLSTSEYLDLILEKIINENDNLNSKALRQQNLLKLLDDKIDTLVQKYVEPRLELLALRSAIESQNEALDSISTELVKLKEEEPKQNFDSLNLLSPNGDKIFYFGSLNNNYPNGFGIGFYQGKGYYIGEWQGNLRHGKGHHFFKDGSNYEGNFVNDKREGYGVYNYNTGEIYKGYWKNDLMSGEGEIISPNGSSTKGTFADGKLVERK